MKSFLNLIIAIVFAPALFAQIDIIYTVNNWGGSSNAGIAQHSINYITGDVSATNFFANEPTEVFNSEALAINSSGYLYSIPKATNTGEFSVYSIKPANPLQSQAPSTPVLTGTITSGGSAVYFRRLGIHPNGWAYMVSSSANNTLYFSRFQTFSDGTASNFQMLGTMLPSDGASTGFFNGDLVFDDMGNMYVLVNGNSVGGSTKIYKVNSVDVIAATSTSTTTLNLMGTVVTKTSTDPDPVTYGAFEGVVTGLAFASNGNLYLSSQSPSQGLFLISKDNTSGTIIATRTNYYDNGGIADIASASFSPTHVLPVVYKSLSAKILRGELKLNWQTSSETNNKRFDIEISNDGKNFVKVGTVNSKAINGISSNDLDYQFSFSLKNSGGVLGMSIFALAFIGLPVIKRRRRIILSFVMLAGIIMFGSSCEKRKDQIDLDNYNKVFVRLVQYDSDGKKEVSKVITAYKAD